MREEIALLREELTQAKMETQLLASKPRTSADCEENRAIKASGGDDDVVLGDRALCPSCNDPEGLANVRQCLEEVEERLNQSNVMLACLSQCLRSLKGKMMEVLGREKVGKSHLEKLVRECLDLVRSCDHVDGDPPVSDGDSPVVGMAVPDNSEEIISHLRAELERYREDLKTDEQAFAEKMEEIVELQFTCDVLSREKARAEAMWMAAQDTEAELQGQVEELQKRLLAVVGGVEDVGKREGGVADDVGVAPEGGHEEGVAEVSAAEMSEDSLSENQQPWGAANQDYFQATRSLMKDKVKTDSLEVHACSGASK